MRHKYEMARYTSKPEYRQALQELIKFEIQALVSLCTFPGIMLHQKKR